MKLKHANIFSVVVILALIVYAAVTMVGVKSNIARAQADQVELRSRVDGLLQENAELTYDIQHAEDPATIAEIARTKLGLVMPGEKIFYDVSN